MAATVDESDQMDFQTPLIAAETKKKEGNALYTAKDYRGAVRLYSEALDCDPTNATCYSNRAAAFLALNYFDDALNDCEAAIRHNPSFVKAYFRKAKCHVGFGDLEAARVNLMKVLELEPGNMAAKAELQTIENIKQLAVDGEDALEGKKFDKVMFLMSQALTCSPASIRFKLMRAEALVCLKKLREAQHLTIDILRKDGTNADALYVRGLCYYYQDDPDKASQHFVQVLRSDPEHKKGKAAFKLTKALKTKREAGNAHFKVGKYSDALDSYTAALDIDPSNAATNAKLFYNRALAKAQLRQLEESVSDCDRALELDPDYIKAYYRRAKSYTELDRYEDAVRDYETVLEKEPTHENRQYLRDAKKRLKLSKRKDYYKILNVSKSATDDEIKRSYKKLAMKYHPDRHSSGTPEDREEAERMFKEVGQAYSVLSDRRKKARYDNGEDLDEMDGFGFDPTSVFQQFFAGGGGGFFGGGGPGRGFSFGGGPGSSYEFSFG
ncbi:dnaJ homolog subfamily C member 7-like [Oscarella lobularis]|uniref:dnaJ homolog subfamily C member 7-like n=1 Tax=Oscarella lobularis TaxID=121494 RepID=UPI0033134DE6